MGVGCKWALKYYQSFLWAPVALGDTDGLRETYHVMWPKKYDNSKAIWQISLLWIVIPKHLMLLWFLTNNASAIAQLCVSSLLTISKHTSVIKPTTKVKKRQSLRAESFLARIWKNKLNVYCAKYSSCHMNLPRVFLSWKTVTRATAIKWWTSDRILLVWGAYYGVCAICCGTSIDKSGGG